MKYFFKRAEENELRLSFEKGITGATLYYKDSDGVRKGIEELKKRKLYHPHEIAKAMSLQEMTTEEVAVLLETCPELEEKARLTVDLLEMFETLPAERKSLAIENLKENYPAIAEALSKIKSPTSEATQAGRATNQAQ